VPEDQATGVDGVVDRLKAALGNVLVLFSTGPRPPACEVPRRPVGDPPVPRFAQAALLPVGHPQALCLRFPRGSTTTPSTSGPLVLWNDDRHLSSSCVVAWCRGAW